jgi:uncharacterized protein
MHPILDPAFLLLAIPAIFAVGLSKGGMTAVGGLAVPLLAMAVPPSEASGIVLPLLCLSDLFAMWTFRRYLDRRLLWPLVSAAAVGIVLGFASFGLLAESTIGLLIGAVTVLFTLRHWLSAWIPSAKDKPTLRAGLAWSAVSGYTSFIAHAGGPPLMFYLLPLRLDRMVFTGTSVFFFGVVNLLKLPPYGALGLLNPGNLATSALLSPLALIGVWVGNRLLKTMDDALFYRLGYILTFAAGLKLVWDGVVPLL